MILKGSRYEHSLSFIAEDGLEPLFKGVRPRAVGLASGILEYTVTEGDRLDLLALHFYNDARRWWRILDANPNIIFGADMMLSEYIGETILIPRSSEAGDGI